jgi:hypothetical protein
MKLKPHKIYQTYKDAMTALFMYPPGEAKVVPYNGKWIIVLRG